MFWADKLIKDIPNKNIKHRVDDMKTVSGMPHVGSLRAVATHDIIYKVMKEAGFKVEFTYVFNDMDPMRNLPVYLDEKEYQKHMGKPLYKIPSPVKGYNSFGYYYAFKYKEAFNKIGCDPKVIWSHELYADGKMDGIVRIALDNAYKIRQVYKKVAGQETPNNWHPYQVICEKCGKVATTIVVEWDGDNVAYECRKDLVSWAVGCGYKGRIKPIKENGKLMWKVDWPAHWKVLNITVEGAGKDHFSQGGSRDVGAHICKEVFKTNPPYGFLHEFFLVGGKKMSSSKGKGIGADKITKIIPPYLLRFLIAKTPLRKAVSFDPFGNTIADLFDEYDKYADFYYHQSQKSDFARIWQLSQVGEIPGKKPFFPRFRDVANYLQSASVDVFQKFADIKGSKLTVVDKEILNERIRYAKLWLKDYAPDNLKVGIIEEKVEGIELSAEQKKYLELVAELLKKHWGNPEDLQQELYASAKSNNINPQKAFTAIYLSLTGKQYGPKAAWFLLDQDKDMIIKRFKKIIGK